MVKISEYLDEEKWSTACLRIRGEAVAYEAISAKLGLVPTPLHRVGESLRRIKPVWRFESPLPKKEPLSSHVNWLLEACRGKEAVIRELASALNVELFCGFSSGNGQGSFSLENELLSRISGLGLSLVLDLYPPGAEMCGEIEE